MGGDEFVVLLTALHSEDEAFRVGSRIAGKILDTLSSPFDLNGHEVCISASIGQWT